MNLAPVAELVDAEDLSPSVFDVQVRVLSGVSLGDLAGSHLALGRAVNRGKP